MSKILLCFISILTCILWCIVSFIVRKKRKKISEMRKAAYDIMKEDALNGALINNEGDKSGESQPRVGDRKIFVHIEFYNLKPKLKYVFDPEKHIIVGRGQKGNTICLRDATVSLHHCEIYTDGRKVYIRDMGSSNKTILKRRIKKIELDGSEGVEVLSGNKVFIGTTEFKIVIFEANVPMI